MNERVASDIAAYLDLQELPLSFPSNKSNFIATAKKFKLNAKKFLTRDGKVVVTKAMQEDIYNSLHKHSGRTSTWERIKSR